MLKRAMIAVGSALLLSLASATAHAEDLLVGIPTSARPFGYIAADGQMAGFNPELGRLLCQALRADCRLESIAFPQLLSGVAAGRVQIGIGNVLKTPEREKQMLFSRPIWRSTTSLIAATSLEALPAAEAVKRHAVCVVGKTSQAEWLAGQVADRPDQAVPFATVREVFEGLRAGRCTLALMPTANALEFLTGDQGVGFDYYGPPLDAPSLGGSVHIIFPPGRSDLRDVVDEAVERLMMDGSYRTLISRFFPFDIL